MMENPNGLGMGIGNAVVPFPIEMGRENSSLPACFLTTQNFHKFQWFNLRLLMIEDVVQEIVPEMLKLTGNSIHTIEFMGVNRSQNIPLLLSHCPNLVCLIFTHVELNGNLDVDIGMDMNGVSSLVFIGASSSPSPLLDHHEHLNEHCSISNNYSAINSSVDSSSSSPTNIDSNPNSTSASASISMPAQVPDPNPNPSSIIKLSQLVRITFNGMGELSQDEIRILHFLTRRVECPSFKTLSFEPKHQRNQNRNRIGMGNENPLLINANVNADANSGSSRLNRIRSVFDWTSVLTKFLAKNSQIKILVAERPLLSLSLSQSSSVDEDTNTHTNMKTLRKIEKVQLQELTCNVASLGSGFERLLRHQRELEILNCYSSPNQNQNLNQNVQVIRVSQYDAIFDTVQRCSASLKTIRITHKVVFSEEDETLGNVPEFLHHDCSLYGECLNLSHLSLSLSLSNELARSRMKPGGILNPQLLPESLKTLIIRFDVMSEDQMNLLSQRLPSLQNLSLFLLYGNSDYPFKIRLNCLQILTELSKIQIFEMSSCIFEDWEGIQNFIRNSPQLVTRLEVTPESCTFWKSR